MANHEDLYIDQGSTFTAELSVKKDGLPFDLTDYTYEGQIRKKVTSNIVASFEISQSTDSDRTNVLIISMTPDDTMLLTESKYVYDIEVSSTASDSTDIFRVLQGTIYVSPNVTKDSE